jgi:hypothetical protein
MRVVRVAGVSGGRRRSPSAARRTRVGGRRR